MTVSRPLVWFILALMVVPAMTVGADRLDRQADAVSFRPAPLVAHANHTYDVRVVSSFLGIDQTAPGHAHIDIGPKHVDGRFGAQGEVAPWVAVRTLRHAAPWDHHVTLPIDGLERLRTDQQWSKSEYVRLSDGKIVHRALHHAEHDWYDMGQEVMRRDRAVQRDIHRPETVDWPLDHVIAHLQTTYHYRDTGIIGADDEMPGRHAYTDQRGTIDGRIVYGFTTTAVHEASAGARYACDLPLPFVEYREPVTEQMYAQRSVWVQLQRTLWLDPQLALPVYATCHAEFRNIGADGVLLGTINVQASLSAHEPGRTSLPIQWSLTDGAHALPPATRAINSWGVVRDNGAGGFTYPLATALADVTEAEDHEVRAFLRGASTTPVVIHAAYRPDGSPVACHDPVAPMLGPISCRGEPRGAQDEATLDPYWDLYLADDAGNWMRLHAQASYREAGHGMQRVDGFVMPVATGRLPHGPVDRNALPDGLVPIDVLFAEWLDKSGVSAASWRASPGSFFRYSIGVDDGYGPTYQFRIDADPVDIAELTRPRVPAALLASPTTPQEADDSGGGKYGDFGEDATMFSLYRARDGVLLQQGRDRADAYGVARPAKAATVAEPLSVQVVDAPRDPSFALVVGVASMFGMFGLAKAQGARRLLSLTPLPLFTKLTRDQVVEHKTRDEMITFVAENPGVGTEEIRRHLSIGWGTAVYHLAALEQNRVLSSLKTGGHRHWFPAHSIDPHTKAAIATLHSAAARRIYEAICANPGATQQEIARDVGVTHGAVIFQVRKLVQTGLVEKRRSGRFVRYSPGNGPGTTTGPDLAADAGGSPQ